MKIIVLSRQQMIKQSYKINEPCALISIIGTLDSKPNFKHNTCIQRILELQFDDVEQDNKNEYAMSYEDAVRVVEFIKSIIAVGMDVLYIHCEAGISRSAGVAAAISKVLNGDDSYFFKRPYCPNMKCYRQVLKAFGMDITPTQLTVLNNKINEEIRKELESE